MKRGIIATIGPASLDSKMIKELSKSGLDIGRINTKYGNEKQWESIIKNLKKNKKQVLIDIKGLDKIEWVKKQRFDFLAVSFAETKEQLNAIRKMFNKKIKIISKIESKRAINNIDELIKESEGIMVARGDLGKNVGLEKLPFFQKMIIKKCNQKHKLVITATEMLLSMTQSKTPERAEVSDVANAILDGSDYLMLSEETAIGKYPVLCVKEMKRIIQETLKDNKMK